MHAIIRTWNKTSLIKRIGIGVILGLLLGVFLKNFTVIGLLGDMFVGGLKAIAPILVFALVSNALAHHQEGKQTNMVMIVFFYLLGTFTAAVSAVLSYYVFPQTLVLGQKAAASVKPPKGIGEIFQTLLSNLVDNPIHALANANYIGILAWAVVFGFALRSTNKHTKDLISTFADVTTRVVRWIINLAPFGILGLVFKSISENGLKMLLNYGSLILVLVGTMAFVALVVNPIIAFIFTYQNPYPLVLRCLRDSGISAFFTRSSAANIPVNMQLCEDLGLNKDTYAVSIPLGSTINMGGAAITINVLTLAAVHTLGISIDFGTAILLSVVAAISACGASGVSGGSLLLIPVACSLFGISNDIAMKVVSVGFIIGVIQDSCETALNSSTDVLFTAIAEKNIWRKKAKKV